MTCFFRDHYAIGLSSTAYGACKRHKVASTVKVYLHVGKTCIHLRQQQVNRVATQINVVLISRV